MTGPKPGRFSNQLEGGVATALGWAIVALLAYAFFGNKVSI